MSMSVQQCAQRMREATREAAVGLVDREALVDLIVLAAVAREHVLVLGPPGTAKSAVVRSVAHILGGRYFEYLLGRFTEPNELFGPVDLRKLREGTVETQTTGMLPEADIAFLDEVFLGSTAILNTLLGILNERTFRRGHTHLKCPLKVCVGAANAMPLDESLAAFADRFLVHYFVAPLPDSLLEELLESGWSLRHDEDRHPGTWQDVDWLADAARRADLSGVRNALAHCVRLLRRTSVELSDRRIVRAQHLIAAAAVLAGRERPTESDLWPLVYAVPIEAGQAQARDVLKDVLVVAENTALPTAAEQASTSALARAVRIAGAAETLLELAPVENVRASRHLRIEALLREIDAGFSEPLPEQLQSARGRLMDALKDAPAR